VRTVAVAVLVVGCGRWHFDPIGANGDATTGTGDGVGAQANTVFLSSTMHDGNLGGLAGADAICQGDANAAGLAGSYIALLWINQIDPTTRLGTARGWVDVTGRPIADQPGDFTASNTIYPIQYTADRTLQRGQLAWVGSLGEDCNSWSDNTAASMGAHASSDELITPYLFSPCTSSFRLICLEHTRSTPVSPPQETGRLAFETTATWYPNGSSGGGLSGADAYCAMQATAAGLPGTFLAMLATSTATAASRFDLAGPPWRRVDGVRLTQNAADLFSGPAYLDTFLARTAGNQPALASLYVWRGGAGGTCGNWSVMSTGGDTGLGITTEMVTFGYENTSLCASGEPLICLQM
jgi:hypothetical protein